MQSPVSPLQHQYVMFNELIRVADDIIEQQTEIKLKTERMKLKNEELQTKSRELQEVLKSSQQQLLCDTSIPIELINQLAMVVRAMKESHHVEFQELIALFNKVQSQFERQQKVFESSVKENGSDDKEDKGEEILESGQEISEKAVKNDETKVGDAWNKEEKVKSNLTILQVKEEKQSCSASVDSPASHSEVVTTDLLASLTRSSDKGVKTENVSQSQHQKNSLVKCVSVEGVAKYSSPTHNGDRTTKLEQFKNSSKTTFAKSVESGKDQYKEVNLHLMTSKELEDHLEGLRNTVKRLQHSQCSFKPVEEETDISCS